MADKVVTIKLYYDGIFKKTTYSGGKTFTISRIDPGEFSYPVLMEYVKDYLKLTEIGGVYTRDDGSWKLLTRDKELIELVNGCENDAEIALYVDTVVDKEIEPLSQMQPHVTIRPRQNIMKGPAKQPPKRKFVTSHQLQQEQAKKMKMNQKSPQLQRRILSPRQCKKPVAETPQNEEATVIKNGTARRKLYLHEGKSRGENDIVEPLPAVNEYEQERINRVLENKAKFAELGLAKYGAALNPPTVQKSKGKEQDQEESDEYILENESEQDSDDSLKAIKKKASKSATAKNKGVKSSSAQKLLNPKCSKLLKQCGNFESGSVSAYVALRERQEQNLEADPRIEDLGESSIPHADKQVASGPKKVRGRSKLLKVHGRTSDQKVVITLNERGQPIGDKKSRTELSNFLGTLVKDLVPITHVNWHVVPDKLKKKMFESTHEKYDIPEHGQKWINKTLRTSWRVHKSRVKSLHYTKYNTNDERIENRPGDISLEDFKSLLMYWADEGVQSLAKINTTHRTAYADPHTLGRKPLADVRAKLKGKNPNLESPSNSRVYFKSRKRRDGRKYKTTDEAVKNRIDSIEEMLKEGKNADELLPSGKHASDWLVGRQGQTVMPQPNAGDLAQITQQLEAKFRRQLRDNMAWMLQKLGEANPDLKIDVGHLCATVSSDQDENGSPITPATQTPGTQGDAS